MFAEENATWIERLEDSIAKIDEELRLVREGAFRQADETLTLREFVRQQTLRMERSAREIAAEGQRLGELRKAEMEVQVLERQRESEERRREMAEQSDQIRANTQAVLRMLDRLDDQRGKS